MNGVSYVCGAMIPAHKIQNLEEETDMRKGTIEQIDYLRDKVGMTYEEAVDMLDRFDGDLAKCMVEVERQGRVRPDADPMGRDYYGDPRKGRRPAFVLDWESVKRVLFSRVSVRKGDTIVTNLTVLSWLFVMCAAPWVLVIGVIATFLTGCKIKWNKNAADPNLDFHSFVGQAAENIRRTTDSVVAAVKSEDAPIKADQAEERKEDENA